MVNTVWVNADHKSRHICTAVVEQDDRVIHRCLRIRGNILHGLNNGQQSDIVEQQDLVAGVNVRLFGDPLLNLCVTVAG